MVIRIYEYIAFSIFDRKVDTLFDFHNHIYLKVDNLLFADSASLDLYGLIYHTSEQRFHKSSSYFGPRLELSTGSGPWLESSSSNGLGNGRGRRKGGSERGCEEVWVGLCRGGRGLTFGRKPPGWAVKLVTEDLADVTPRNHTEYE